MQQNIALSVRGLSKDFRLPHERRNSLKERILNFRRRQTFEKFHALQDINLEIKRGEFFGVMGRNGSGKSTLLKIIGGIYQPTRGAVIVNGTLTPFIELGIGFNPELTGRENIFLNGAILGLTHKEIAKKYDEIVAFAELEKFMDQKLKNYSSGMQVRLAFSIAIQAHNDILLIDEVLAVGDINFQQKCFEEFKKIKASGKTVVFISHDLGAIERYCDRAAILDRARIVDTGEPKEMALKYGAIMAEEMYLKTEKQKNKVEDKHQGSGKATIKNAIIKVSGKPVRSIGGDDSFVVEFGVEIKEQLSDVTLGIAINNNDRISVVGPNTLHRKKNIDLTAGAHIVSVELPALKLTPGRYSVTVGIFNKTVTAAHDYVENVTAFNVLGEAENGIVHTEAVWHIN